MAQNWSSNDNETCDTFQASSTWQEPERQMIEEKYFASVLAVRCSTFLLLYWMDTEWFKLLTYKSMLSETRPMNEG